MTEPIWFLTTRDRPDACQAVLDACEATGMTSRAILWVDGGDRQDEYRRLRVPWNWTVRFAKRWGSLGPAHQWIFDTFPKASQYGWLADDTYPRTKHWDKRLEEAAGDSNISYAKDLFFSEEEGALASLRRGTTLSSGICYGGGLVRATGWLSLPGLTQAGIDTAWTAIVSKLRRWRYLEDVVVEHQHYTTGKRVDEGWSDHALPHIAADLRLRDEWITSIDYINTLERIVRLNPSSGPPVDYMDSEPALSLADLQRIQRRQVAEEERKGRHNMTAWEDLPQARREAHLQAGGEPYDVVADEKVERVEETPAPKPAPKKPAAKKPAAKKK